MTLLLTERHIKDMKHCIGMDQKRPYKRHEKLFYRPWRNYYATGPECEGVDIWLDLEKHGCAVRQRFCNWTFKLTRKGLDVLGMQLNVQIHDE